MKDRKELVLCNCKDNKYHNLPGWHEDHCLYKKWWDGDEAAPEMNCVICGEKCKHVAVNSLHPYPRPVHIECFKKVANSDDWFDWYQSIVFEVAKDQVTPAR